MKPKQTKAIEFNIKDHTFVLVPISIKSDEPMTENYLIELDKGCQKVGSLEEMFDFDRNHSHTFSKKAGVTVKAYKEKEMSFSWSLYFCFENLLEFTDCFKFSLQDCYLQYTQEIRSYAFEYNRICQQKDCNQMIGDSWNRMKSHLRKNKTIARVRSSKGNFTLQFSIEIRNELDSIAQREMKKMLQLKIDKIDRSRRSESDLKSASSRTQLKEKDVITLENVEEKKEEAKIQSIIKHDDEEILVQVSSVHQQVRNHFQTHSTDHNFLQPKRKENTVLSDIIEASNEESHKLERHSNDENYIIPQNNQQENFFSKTKTFHFKNQNNQERMLKRNNSLESPKLKNQVEDQDIEEKGLNMQNKPYVTQQSLTKNDTPECRKAQQNNGRLKYILLLLLIYGLTGYFLRSQLPSEVSLEDNLLSKGRKISKRKLQFNIFQ